MGHLVRLSVSYSTYNKSLHKQALGVSLKLQDNGCNRSEDQ